CGAVVTRLCKLRHVRQFHASRPGIHCRSGGAGMSTRTNAHALTAFGSIQRKLEAPGRVNVLLVVMLLLMTIGLLMMTSASVEIANGQYGDPFFFFKRQASFAVLGLGLVAVTLHLPVRVWYANSG